MNQSIYAILSQLDGEPSTFQPQSMYVDEKLIFEASCDKKSQQ